MKTLLFFWQITALLVLLLLASCVSKPPMQPGEVQPAQIESPVRKPARYHWTNDHMQVGVRWQPFGLNGSEAYDAKRPVIARDSSYAQFWVSWAQAEPEQENTDYARHMSPYLQSIDRAVDECVKRGLKVELVFWHCPAWASQSGKAGPWKPKRGLYKAFAIRMARHFKGRVESYQLHHEANLKSMMEDGDIDFLISELFIPGARAIRAVYNEPPSKPVLISPGGTSPCEACDALPGLQGKGAVALEDFYERLASNRELMPLVDALNLNVSDHMNGYGMMDGEIIKAVWDHYDLVRAKLDKHGHPDKGVLSSESWIVWDSSGNAADVNGDGLTNELDAYDKTVTILGKCLERGLNTLNLPWSDNASPWSMGLTKRRDYNGRIQALDRRKVLESADGESSILAEKIDILEDDGEFVLAKAPQPFRKKDYANPRDPNHLHYYIWKWYAQIAGGTDEVIRHTIAGERGNDIRVEGIGWTGKEQYKISSWNRTKRKFTVLIYSDGANGKAWARISLPATIQTGKLYNNKYSRIDYRGEGFPNGTRYRARITTKGISRDTGGDIHKVVMKSKTETVQNGELKTAVIRMGKFTKIEFEEVD
jgi:hypothetical protein